MKLVASIIYKDEEFLKYAEKGLKRLFGPLEDIAKTAPFDYTDYYYPEFGRPLKRKLICFRKPVKKENIKKVKLETNKLEDRTRAVRGVSPSTSHPSGASLRTGPRKINIDPGYVTEAKLVLLTTKDYTHRVYLGQGIFAESTLFYQDRTFRSWPWTYPDYTSQDLIAYFNEVRRIYINGH